MLIDRNESIERLDLSVRSWKCCIRNHITTIGDLIDQDDDFIERVIANHSQIVYHEIIKAIQEYKNNMN